MRVCSFLLSLLLLLAAPCGAASLEETFAQAQAAFKAGDFARAGELFAAAGDQLQKSGDAARAGALWGNAAVAHIKVENWAAAADLYERILAANKRLPQDQALRFYKNLVLCRGNLNQRALQITAIDRMLKALPKLPPAELADAYARQGDAYRQMELYGPAVASYDKAAHLLPAAAPAAQKARIFTALGLCQGYLGDYAKAIQNLEQARTLAEAVNEPLTVAESDSNLGILHLERGDYPKAMELLKSALDTEKKAKLRRSEGIDHNNLGLVYKAVGSHQEAMRHVEQSLAIAREVKNVRDEGIAMINRALIHRIAGKLHEARADYREAMKLFEQCGYQKGMAGVLLGIGRMEALADKNYALALENYQKALDIYTRLSLPRERAETLLQLGEVYKYTAAPGRTTRDLVFDDEPTLPQVAPDKAIAQSRAYYAQALELAQQLQSKELIWSAHQGLGYADLREGKLEEALKHYMTAIDMVTSMYASLESVELLGEYMAGKEDLYSEAQEVCAALYEKTKDKKYLDLQMKYAETLRNEVQKASAALVQLQFEDKDKQALYEKLQVLGRQQAKAAKAVPMAKPLPKDATPEQKAEKALSDKAIKEQKAAVQKLEGDYKKLLAEWDKEYPEDKVLYSSESGVTVKTIQENIRDTDAVLRYDAEHDTLSIHIITKDKNILVPAQIGRKKLDDMIRKEFLINYIEGPGRNRIFTRNTLNIVSKTLHDLYNYLILPVKEYIKNTNRIYIISDGFLAQVPFSALISSFDEQNLEFLIEKYEIGYLRPSFIDTIKNDSAVGSVKKLLGIGNPVNINYFMDALMGTVDEISNASNTVSASNLSSVIAVDNRVSIDVHSNVQLSKKIINERFAEIDVNDERKKLGDESLKELFPDNYPLPRPTEKWLRRELADGRYEVLYFATHGMPYSDVYVTYKSIFNAFSKGESSKAAMLFQKGGRLAYHNLKTKSPLNGFLYLSDDGSDVLKNDDIPENNDGLLTIKEVLELPANIFSGTKYVILSACNTGVTFVPKSVKASESEGVDIEGEIFNLEEMHNELKNLGFSSDTNQVSFVESFMRRGVTNVYGNLWQADDFSSSIIMSTFFKKLVEQKDHPDAIAALTEAQRDFLQRYRNGNLSKNNYALDHPYLWACGAIFGK